MIRRHVLAALAAGVDAGDDEAARERVEETDWVLRGAVRRLLEHALIDATLLTREHGAADPEGRRHVHRVAALNIAGRFDVDVHDRRRVATAYATLDALPPPRAPIATIVASTTAVFALVSLVWLGIVLGRPTPRAHPQPHFVAGAYFCGGTPARDEALERFLVEEMTSFAIETDADRRGSEDGLPRAKHAAELRDAPQIAAYGPALATAWRDLIDSLDRWSTLPIGTSHLREAAAELGQRAQRVSDRFAALGLGYYVQADVLLQGTARLVLFIYRVEDVTFVRAGGDRRRVLGLRRLDHVNLALGMLGRQGDELGDPVVLLDQIDELVAERVMPTVEGASYSVGEDRLAVLAGAAIRRELPPDRDRVRAIITASVRRHEARHGIDLDRDKPLRYPAPLAALIGKGKGEASRRFELRARAELAAYVSQIGNEPVTPHFALWNLASQAFHRERWGSAESYAAVVVIEGLGRQFGIVNRPSVQQGTLDRSRLAAVATRLTAQSSDTLRMAARKLWIELYGEPMLPIVDLLR